MFSKIKYLPLLLLCSCEMLFPGMKIPKKPIDIQFKDFNSAWYWVSTNIVYKSDMDAHGRREEWQLPEQTYYLMTGDCEDFALLLGYFADKLGKRSEIVGMVTPEGGHSILYVDGRYIDPGYYGYYYSSLYVERYETNRWDYHTFLSAAETRSIAW